MAKLDLEGKIGLVIDPNNLIRNDFISSLERNGCLVDEAKNGLKGIAMAEKRIYDFVVVELNMKDPDGRETTRKIRAIKGYEHLPIIIYSGLFSRENVSDCGATAYFYKGETFDKLVEKIKHQLAA